MAERFEPVVNCFCSMELGPDGVKFRPCPAHEAQGYRAYDQPWAETPAKAAEIRGGKP